MVNVIYFLIEVDLWLVLFLKGENSGGMGCVLKSVNLIYLRPVKILHQVWWTADRPYSPSA